MQDNTTAKDKKARKGTSILIPTSEKTKEWHKDYHDYIISLSTQHLGDISTMQRNLDITNGKIDLNDYLSVILNSDGALLPTEIVPVNRLKRFIRQVGGEITSKKIDPEIVPLSRAAVAYRAKEELDIKADFAIGPIAKTEEREYGLPLQKAGTPDTEEELKDKLLNYKDIGQVIMKRIIDDIVAKNNLKHLVKDAAVKGLWAGRYHAMPKIENGEVVIEAFDPRFVIPDYNCEENGKDCHWIVTWKYIHAADAIAKGLTQKEVEDLIKQAGSGIDGNSGTDLATRFPAPALYDNDSDLELVLWTRVEWIDTKDMLGLTYENNGKTFYSIRDAEFGDIPESERKKAEKDIKSAKEKKSISIKTVRHAEVIGMTHVCSYGETQNMPRSYDSWPNTSMAITSFMPEWTRYDGNVPLISEVAEIQRLFNQTWSYILRNMRRDKGKLMTRDASLTPESFTREDVTYIAETVGEIMFDTSKQAINTGQPPVGSVDMSMGNIQQYAQILGMLNMEMEIITGISSPRMGGIADPNVRVGVNDASQIQSRIQSIMYYSALDDFIQNLLTNAVALYKMLIINDPDRYSNIIGDDGVRWIKENQTFEMFDYGFHIKSMQINEQTRQMIRQMAMEGVGANAVSFADGIITLLEENPYEAKKQLFERIEKREEQARQMEQAKLQQEGRIQEQQQMIDAAKAQATNKIEGQKLDLDAAKASADIMLKGKQLSNGMQPQAQ